jgi:hypothetical protein
MVPDAPTPGAVTGARGVHVRQSSAPVTAPTPETLLWSLRDRHSSYDTAYTC